MSHLCLASLSEESQIKWDRTKEDGTIQILLGVWIQASPKKFLQKVRMGQYCWWKFLQNLILLHRDGPQIRLVRWVKWAHYEECLVIVLLKIKAGYHWRVMIVLNVTTGRNCWVAWRQEASILSMQIIKQHKLSLSHSNDLLSDTTAALRRVL